MVAQRAWPYGDRRARLAPPLEIGATTMVRSLRDLPDAVGGVITLPANTSWMLASDIDLEGARLVCAGRATIWGQSSETTTLSSTGLTGQPIIYTQSNLVLLRMTIYAEAGAVGARVESAGTAACDWSRVNFIGEGRGCELLGVDNFLSDVMLYTCDEGGLYVNGDVNTLAITDSLITASSASFGVSLDTSASVNRRLRIADCSIICGGTGVGIACPAARIVNSEAMILRDLNISGPTPANYVTGITYLDDKARWTGNRGITNTTRTGLISWASNATTTNIASSGTYYKATGTAVASAFNQRFSTTPTPHRLTYTSALVQTFEVTATVSISAGNNNIVGVKVYKNGSQIDAIRGRSTTSANNRAEGVTVRTIVEMGATDYLEVYVTNESSTGNITVTDMTLLARVI